MGLTARGTFHSGYPLRVFQTKSTWFGPNPLPQEVLTPLDQLCHPFVSSSRKKTGNNGSSSKCSKPLWLCPDLSDGTFCSCTSNMHMTMFPPLWKLRGEKKKSALMVYFFFPLALSIPPQAIFFNETWSQFTFGTMITTPMGEKHGANL